jgi:hypothetical protein
MHKRPFVKVANGTADGLLFGYRRLSILLVLCVTGITVSGVSTVADAVAWRWPYLCHFAEGSAVLTDRCHLILGEAVASWHREQEGRQPKSDAIDPADPYAPPYTAHLVVLGFAPDANTPAAADLLSRRRASSVAAELEHLGIPHAMIMVEGLGSKEPLVPNAPTDPQNRLVNVAFR